MKVLITGGCGFIGSHLAERCLHEGWTVTVVDNLSTGSLANIAHLTPQPALHFHEGSACDSALMEEMVNSSDVIFHLAATVGVRLVVDNPLECIETNVGAAGTVLRAASVSRRKVILASSSEVYGKNPKLPLQEEHDLILGSTRIARWGYACSKALNEFLGLAYWSERRVPVTIVRLFNTVGPRQSSRYGMVLPTFVRRALKNEDLIVYGTGKQRRCFVDVAEVAEALVRIARNSTVAGEVINIGGVQELSILELATLVIELSRSKSRIRNAEFGAVFGPNFEEPGRRIPSLDKLVRLVGYQPTRPLERTIEDIIAYERGNIEGSSKTEQAEI